LVIEDLSLVIGKGLPDSAPGPGFLASLAVPGLEKEAAWICLAGEIPLCCERDLDMLQDTITKIEARLQNSAALGKDQRAELLTLLGQLKTEITALSKTHQEQAESIASFAEVSAREAMRGAKNPQTLQHSIGGLKSSVGEFETTHPRLAAVVNRIASVLANMGI
jgi:hypothetical protein